MLELQLSRAISQGEQFEAIQIMEVFDGKWPRTGKRNWRGVLNDASNSIGRLYQNTVGDFFKQSMLVSELDVLRSLSLNELV